MATQLNLFDPNQQLLTDLFQAYYDARRNKRNTKNQLRFERNYESKLFVLYEEIINRKYTINPSICFINFDPVQREIFAADFRDRIVHHLIFNYINPVFERVFIHDAYSCRKGKGTSYGIERLEHFIHSSTENYKYPAYILKLDIKGYFMAMNRQLLFDKVVKTLIKFRDRNIPNFENLGYFFDTMIYLIEKVIFNDPTQNCIIKSKKSAWQGLPPSKSLFKANNGCGLPIGNLTSQLFGNVYMNDFDHFVKCKLGCKYYGRYVDDFVIVHRDKQLLKEMIPQLSTYLHEQLQLTLHPKKIYLQSVDKGTQFLGVLIKPYRIYLKNRTKGNFIKTLKHWNNIVINKPVAQLTLPETKQFVSAVNSYLGLSKHFATYKMRSAIIKKNMSLNLWKDIYLYGKQKFVIKKMFIKSNQNPNIL